MGKDPTQRNRIRYDKTKKRRRAIETTKGRWKSFLVTLVIGGLLITSVKGTGEDIYPQNEPLQQMQFKSINQHIRHLIKSGLPYSWAITRLMSDTPIQNRKKQSQQGGRGDGIIEREMTRLREQGIQYGRAATLSVDSDRLPTCQVNVRKESGQEAAQGTSQEVKSGESESANKVASGKKRNPPKGIKKN